MKTFLILACLATYAFAVDYCSMSSCRGAPHIACRNNGALSGNCVAGSKVVEITPALIATFLGEHNNNRNIIASGGLSGFKPALRMATVQWDEELAKLAAMNVKRCLFQHDQCRNTEQFSQSGQNLYASYSSAPIPSNITPLIKSAINSWYMEHKYASMADIDRCPSNIQNIGHFTVMVVDKNVKLGCACVSMPPSPYQPGWHTLLMACNYAATNMVGEKIYASSTMPAIGCKNRNPLYSSLCAVGEIY